jgi:hypothetical protein
MTQPQIDPNPFELMMNPQAVLHAIEGSERLESLQRRVYRPLDKPLIAKKATADAPTHDRQLDLADDQID